MSSKEPLPHECVMQLTGEEAWLLDVSVSVVRMQHKGTKGKGHSLPYCSDHLLCTPEAWLCVLGLVSGSVC